MVLFIRSLIFNIYFPLWTAIVSVGFSPLLFTNAKTAAIAGRVWSLGVNLGLKYICRITYEVRGEENLPDGPFIIASKHQSAWDTAIFLQILDGPAYILKKELLSIPFFGHFLKTLEMVPVDRKGGTKALKEMQACVKDRIAKGRSVIIFPEGTRTKPGERIKHQPGIAFIYKDVEAPVIPVALNSGSFWSKGEFYKKPGKIVLQYLPPVDRGLDRKAFTKKLEDSIEENSLKLL